MIHGMIGSFRKALFHRGWFIALLIIVGVVASGIAMSFAGATGRGGALLRWRPPTLATLPALPGPVVSKTGPPRVLAWSTSPGTRPVDQDWTLLAYNLSENVLGQFAATIKVSNDAASARFGAFTLTVTRASKRVASLQGVVSSVAAHQAATITMISMDSYVPGPYVVRFQSGLP
jgi:hypothetical protein